MSYPQSHPYAIPTTTTPHHPPPGAAAGGGRPSSTTTTSTRSPASQSSGSVNRKLVIDPIDGHTREETREERRTRKERERQLRDASPSSSPADPPPPTRTANATPSSSNATSTSSKSVLTIALQRAQSAVLLDSANNFPAAISAYSQSVRLLKEVMARVEQKGAVEMERKGSTGSAFSALSGGSAGANLVRRDSETAEEWEKRKSRWDKKEKAKADEARRLRVIHDTYEDRIKMLLAMNPSLASATSPSIAAAALPTSTSHNSRLGGSGGGGTTSGTDNESAPSPTTASMRFHRRRSSTEIPQIQHQPRVQTHRSTPSSSSSPSSRPSSPSLAGVGQAMMSSDLVSPTSPAAPNGIPRIAQLPVISPSNSFQNLPSHLTSHLQDPSHLSHLGSSKDRPLSTASDSTARGLPLSGTVTPTAPTTSSLPRPLPPPTTSLPPPPPDHPPPPIPTTVVNRNSNSSEGSSSQDEDHRIPVTALDHGDDWPRTSREEEESPGLRLPVVERDPLVGSDPPTRASTPPPISAPTSIPSSNSSTPPRSFPLSRPINSSSPMRRGSSASAVYTLQSHQSSSPPVHSRPPTNSYYSSYDRTTEGGGGGGASISSASMSMRRTMSSEGPNPSSILRPLRSASLASQGQGQGPQVYSSGMVPSLSGGSSSHRSTNSSFSIGNYARSITPAPSTTADPGPSQEAGLVNSTTAGGTISQRRLGGGGGGLTGAQGQGSGGEQLEATIIVRAPSQESHRSSQSQALQGYDEFGSSTRTSGGGGGGGFGSLPGRLRALSQPSQKRPKLPSNSAGSWIADGPSSSASSPPVPPLLSQTSNSSTAPSHRHHLPSLSISSTTTGSGTNRKPSVPTPTSLNAPPFPATLGRSNSSSSVGSSASGRYSDRSLPPPVPSSTTTLSHHAVASSTPSSNFGIPSPPTRSSASSRETVLSIPPVRRPFHLMRLVLATMPNPSTSPSTSRSSVISLAIPSNQGGGGYLSEKLYVPSQIWSIPGSKLVSLETKVRMMEIVLSSLGAVSSSGQSLLSPALANTARNSGAGGERWCLDEATRFMKELESFEGVVEGVQNTLAKKLGGGLISPTGGGIGNHHHQFNDREFGGLGGAGGGGTGSIGSGGGKDSGSTSGKEGRKGSTAGGQFASWSSKFQRGFDRVTNANGVSLDSQTTYVDTVARLFRQSQCIDHHLALLLSTSASSSSHQPEVSAYSLLPSPEKHRLERQLRRASEFFGTVVCRFVMKDVGLLLDKYVKRGGTWLSGE